MATIQELEQKVRQLEKQILDKDLKDRELIDKAEKAIDYAKHAYKVDHYGFIWVWNINSQDYRKTNMRVMTPEIADRALESRNIADNAIEGRHLQDNAIEGRMIKDKTIEGRSIKDDSIGTNQIKDGSITGDSMRPGALPNGKLADDAVAERNLQDHCVTKYKLSTDLISLIYSAGAHGYHLSDQFGDNEEIGINQRALTEAFHHFYQILSDITGEVYEGFSMAVTPDYYVGEDGCTVTITANTLTTVGKFEWIAFYWNSEEEPFLYREDVYGIDGIEVELPLDKLLDDQITIRCEAKILGQVYTEQKAIRHCDSLWLGAGSTYQSVMIPSNLIPASHHMRGAYDVSVTQGQHIIVVVGEALASGFIRADINGVEIDMTESTITQDGNTYKVFTSVNTYQAGTLNIDING